MPHAVAVLSAASASRHWLPCCAVTIAENRSQWARIDCRFACQPAAQGRRSSPGKQGATMLRDPKVIEHLNTQLTNELTAVAM
jgi:hypothetical protein